MDSSINSISIQPNQALLTKDEYNEDWYIRNLRFIAYNFNRTLPKTAEAGINSIGYDYNTFIERWLANCNYYNGVQTKSPFGFFIRDEGNKPITTPMFRGMDIKILIDKLVGNLTMPLKQLTKMISATSMSPNAVSRKMLILDLVRMRHENDSYFNIVSELTGANFEPIGDFDYSDKQAIDTYFTNFKEALEIAAAAIAKSTCYDNHHIDFFMKAALYYAIGGVVSAKAEINSNGRPHWRLISPENSIWDSGIDSDDHHRNDRFGGEIYQYSIPELASMNILTKAELEEAQTIARTSTQWSQFNWTNTSSNFYWWKNSPNGVPTITVVKGQWRSLQNIGTSDEPKWIEVLREGMLIGNKWVKKWGESKNNVEDKTDRSKLKLRYRVLTATTLNGVFYSIVDTLKRYQDLKDAFKTKLINMVSRSKGKAYMIFSDRLPEGMNTPQLLSQLTQAGLVVVPSTDFDDEVRSDKSLMQPIDMTLDPSVLSLAQLIQAEGQYMEQIVSYNPVTLGNVTNYMSKDQIQASTNGSNTGLAYFTTSFYVFVKDIVTYSAELAIKSMAELDQDYISVVVGDGMVETLKSKDIKDASLEDFNIAITIDDFISEQDRIQLMQIALQMASAGAITMADYAKMMSFDSKTELVNYMQFQQFKKEKAEQEAQMAQMQAAAQNAERQAQAQENQARTSAEGRIANTVVQGAMTQQGQEPTPDGGEGL